MKNLDNFIKQEKLHRIEGKQGVQNLARICQGLGYKDPTYFGQFHPQGSYGDLIDFLEDNSGAVEAVLAWIKEENNTEWNENLGSELNDQKLKNCYKGGLCPDCQEEIPDNAKEGESCSNCEHVFCYDDNN